MQEAYRDHPWGLLVGCILFNMVHGSKARPILEAFLDRFPTEYVLLSGGRMKRMRELAKLFEPLGFQNRRAERVVRMTEEYDRAGVNAMLLNDLFPDVSQLHGVGKYGKDSFDIFVLGQLIEDAEDKELRKYVEWAKDEGRDRRQQAS
jgi:hypothetical protein